LPEEQHLSGADSSHYSSLFVIRFPIARGRERERERNSKREQASLYSTRTAIINHMNETTTKTGTLDRFYELEKKIDEIHLPLV